MILPVSTAIAQLLCTVLESATFAPDTCTIYVHHSYHRVTTQLCGKSVRPIFYVLSNTATLDVCLRLQCRWPPRRSSFLADLLSRYSRTRRSGTLTATSFPKTNKLLETSRAYHSRRFHRVPASRDRKPIRYDTYFRYPRLALVTQRLSRSAERNHFRSTVIIYVNA